MTSASKDVGKLGCPGPHARGILPRMGIVIKNALELAKMRRAGAIARAVLDAVEAACVPGTTTAELERIAAREMARLGATSAFLGYNPGNSPPYPGKPGTGRRLKPGMTIAIEPMFTLGGGAVRLLDDRWSVVTADAGLASHVEHTVAVTEHGAEVLAG